MEITAVIVLFGVSKLRVIFRTILCNRCEKGFSSLLMPHISLRVTGTYFCTEQELWILSHISLKDGSFSGLCEQEEKVQ